MLAVVFAEKRFIKGAAVPFAKFQCKCHLSDVAGGCTAEQRLQKNGVGSYFLLSNKHAVENRIPVRITFMTGDGFRNEVPKYCHKFTGQLVINPVEIRHVLSNDSKTLTFCS